MVLKILFVIQGLQSGGAERVVSVLANAFCELSHDVSILLTENNGPSAYYLSEKIKCIDTTSSNGNYLLNRIIGVKKLRHIFRQASPDVIISFITRTNISSIIANIGLNSKIIISERNNPLADPKNKIIRMIRDILYPISDGIVFQTEFAQNCFGKRTIRKSKVIFNPLTSQVNDIAKDSEREKKIIAVCRLFEQKNVQLLIKSFYKVYKDFPEYRVEIYGDGIEKDNLQKIINNLGLNDKVRLMGRTNKPLEIMAKSSIFVLPSNYEGMPNALIEAMSMGCACISTDAPAYGARAVIQNRHNGILVEVGNESEMACALSELIKNDDFRKKIGCNAEKISKMLDVKNITQQWLDYIHSIMI